MQFLDQIRSGAKWLVMGRGLAQAIGWVLTLLSMRFLTPEDYGLMAMASILILLGSMLEDSGVQIKIIQMRELDERHISEIFGFSLIVGIFLTLMILSSASWLARFFLEPRLVPILSVLAFQFVISALAIVPDALIRRNLDLRTIAIIGALQGTLGGGATCALAWAGAGVWAIVVGTVLSGSFRMVALTCCARFFCLPRFNFAGLRPSIRFSGQIVAQRFFIWILNTFDRALLGRFFDGYTVGLYATALEVARMPLDRLGSTVNTVAVVGLSKIAHDIPAYRYYLLQGVRLIATLAFPTFFGISIVAADLVPLALGPQWVPIVPAIIIIAPFVPFRALWSPLLEAVNSSGRAGAALVCTLLICGFTVVGMTVAIISFGLLGVVAIWIIASIFAFFLVSVALARRQELGIPFYQILSQIVPSLLSASFMYLLVHGFRYFSGVSAPSLGGIAISFGIGVTSYIFCLFILDKGAIILVVSMFRQKKIAS